jgi:hypothetical protein
MAIGDAFRVEEIRIEDIREFAIQSGLPQKIVQDEFSKMGKKIHEKLSELKDIAINNQIDIEIFKSIELEIQKNIRMMMCLLETNHPSSVV